MNPKLLSCFVLTALCLTTSPAWAQKVLEMFEGQSDLPDTAGVVQVESLDKGTSTSFGDSGTQVDGGITIRFEREGASILVPATVNGKGVYFIFDTGATTTTLSYEFAQAAGLMPAKDAPVTQVQTANGSAVVPFGLINRLNLGGRDHSGVTFAMCTNCPVGIHKGKPVVGLLGLNVINRYRVSFDESAGKIEMYPNASYSDRRRDIEPWIQVDDFSVAAGSKPKATAAIINRASRSIHEVTVVLKCDNGKRISLGTKSISAKSTQKFSKVITDSCPRFQFDLESPKW